MLRGRFIDYYYYPPFAGQHKKSVDGGTSAFLPSNLLTGGGAGGTGGGSPSHRGLGLLSTSTANLKKVYAAWLMRLRVRTYLASLRVTDDLEVLSQLSHRAEPGANAPKEATPTPPAKSTQPASGKIRVNLMCDLPKLLKLNKYQ